MHIIHKPKKKSDLLDLDIYSSIIKIKEDDYFGSIVDEYLPKYFSSFKSEITSPPANTIDTEDGYSIELAAPGFSRDEFEINVVNRTLTVSASSSNTNKYKNREYSFEIFTRSWNIPKTAMSESITARYDAGILYIYVPTSEEDPQTISIEVE
jgi:HSP20 family protein